jgi:hypothetical protein
MALVSVRRRMNTTRAGPAVRRRFTPSILIETTRLERGRTEFTPLREGGLVCDRQ